MLQTVEISLPELLERVRAGQIPMSARAQVTYDVPAPQEATPPAPGEGSTMTEAEMEEERRLFEQFERNVNETRRACGMRTL